MPVSREMAILFATLFANANGYRVIPTLEGAEWVRDPLPVELMHAVWVEGDFDDEWAVAFRKMLPPEIAAENPAEIIVTVHPKTGACDIPMSL